MSVYDKSKFVKKGSELLETAIAGVAQDPCTIMNADDFTVGTADDVAKVIFINKEDYSLDFDDPCEIGDKIWVARVGRAIVCGVSCSADPAAGKEVDAAGAHGVAGTTENRKIGKKFGDSDTSGIYFVDLGA